MCATDFEQLLRVMPPPIEPVGTAGEWDVIEQSLGISLPQDYKLFVESYGLGKICSFLYVLNPFTLGEVSPIEYVKMTYSGFVAYRDTAPYTLYPAERGLFPLAHTDNGDLINWRQRDGSEEIVVSEGHCDEFVLLEGYSFCSFLLGLQTGDLSVLHKMPFGDAKFKKGLNFQPLDGQQN